VLTSANLDEASTTGLRRYRVGYGDGSRGRGREERSLWCAEMRLEERGWTLQFKGAYGGMKGNGGE